MLTPPIFMHKEYIDKETKIVKKAVEKIKFNLPVNVLRNPLGFRKKFVQGTLKAYLTYLRSINQLGKEFLNKKNAES